MYYKQLSFAPLSTLDKSLYIQARTLLHELMKGRRHKFFCGCGACVYAEYIRRCKAEGRRYSKRTFFVFFLYCGFFEIAFYNQRLGQYSEETYLRNLDLIRERKIAFLSLDSKIADRKNRDKLFDLKPGQKLRDYKLSTDIHLERIKAITRKSTLGMIKWPAQREKRQDVRSLLEGILKGTSFYTYYKGASEDKALPVIVGNIRRSLLKLPDSVFKSIKLSKDQEKINDELWGAD